nr:DUF1080 domain-containing protein [Lacimicrobium alkaliphilum]
MKKRSMRILPVSTTAALLICLSAYAQNDEQKSKKTEVWEPEPEVVSAPAGVPPSDAIVLFDGSDLSQWQSVKDGDANWTVEDGVLTVRPGSGDIRTNADFCDVQLHLEWKVPEPEAGKQGQQRNNSGVFLQQRYEIQILDSYENRTYSNGQAGSLYKQVIPLVNAMRPPEQWQSYDILYTAPRFDGQNLVSPGTITVLHNGVVVQHHTEIQGETVWVGEPTYKAHGCAPLQLQDHGDKVSFRNIWVREL